MKRFFCLALCLLVCLCGCDAVHSGSSLEKEFGFVDEDTDIQYVVCSILSVKPVNIGEVYCEADGVNYYQIPFEEPSRFLCDYDEKSGSSYVYRNKTVEEITVGSFDAVAAWLYADGTSPQRLGQLYADDEYLAEELRGKNPSQDTDKVRMITDALVNGESLAVSLSDNGQNDSYEFRLLSVKYPGLYYSVWFFTDAFGKCYLHDYATDKTVEAPSVISAWVIGGGDEV
ncbi:MAG: hypothetical protein E7651_08960 [Ruminococcaceae bacterium]|nr:hypothetical protein [Oscillospiraceae bacterium]